MSPRITWPAVAHDTPVTLIAPMLLDSAGQLRVLACAAVAGSASVARAMTIRAHVVRAKRSSVEGIDMGLLTNVGEIGRSNSGRVSAPGDISEGSRPAGRSCDSGGVPETKAELVRRGYEAVARGDLAEIAPLLDPDVKWHGGDRSAPDVCGSREQVLQYMRRWRERGEVPELVEIIEAGDNVVVIMRPPPPAGEEIGPLRANLTTFRAGKVVEMVHYEDPKDALAAAGL